MVNVVRPDGLTLVGDWSPEARLTTDSGESMVISLEEAKKVFASGAAVFLDARSEGLYREGHIRGARNLPWQAFEQHLDKVVAEIPSDALIVTYCDGEECALSEDLARELLFMGYEKVRVLINGWTRWIEAGLPTEQG
jgi:rhodanese-related sulfurtransferase